MNRNPSRRGRALSIYSSLVPLATLALACDPEVGPRGIEPQESDRASAQCSGADEASSSSSAGESESDTFDPNPDEPDICPFDDELPACDGGEAKDCIPAALYHKVAAGEYYNSCRNYCHADDLCYDRATAMLGALDGACDLDLRGPDGKWCGEMDSPSSTGTCDDLVYKVVIRYPESGRWVYHIATAVKTCEDGLCIVDPIGQPENAPTTTCQSPEDWCKHHAGNLGVEWGDTDNQPPEGKVTCEIAPGDQSDYRDGAHADPTDPAAVAGVCMRLEDHVKKLCDKGLSPYPPGCGIDADGDTIPDAYDKCPNSPAGADVDYCDPKRLGCAAGENPPEEEEEEECGGSEDAGGDSGDSDVDVPTDDGDTKPTNEPADAN